MLANGLTKTLSTSPFKRHQDKWGLVKSKNVKSFWESEVTEQKRESTLSTKIWLQKQKFAESTKNRIKRFVDDYVTRIQAIIYTVKRVSIYRFFGASNSRR